MTKEEEKLYKEEQQDYIDRGGVLPIAGTNASYARQRRNGNREPVEQNGGLTDEQYNTIMRRVAKENNPKWNEQRRNQGERELSEDEEFDRIMNDNSYDYRGYYTKYPNSRANADTHWNDEFKTVYHPTFSNQSIYSGVKHPKYNPEGLSGGTWNEEDFVPADWQKTKQDSETYIPTPTAPIVQQREPAQLRNWYETLFRQDNADEEAEISDAQRKKMQRRERAERVIAGLGDIGTHIANIAFAGAGATPAQPTTTMSANIDNSWQRYNQDIEQRRKAYRQGLNAARQMDFRQFLEDRKYNLSLDREERLRWQQEHKNDLDKLREAKTKAEIARIEKRTPAEIAVLEQQVAYWQARANESQAKADGKVPTTSRSGGSRRPAYEYDGVVYDNADEWKAAIKKDAKKLGIATYTVDRFGKRSEKSISDILSEIYAAEDAETQPSVKPRQSTANSRQPQQSTANSAKPTNGKKASTVTF